MVTLSRGAWRLGAWLGAIAAATVCLAAQDASRVWTIQELFTRNVGTPASQDEQFPPHRIAGNLYYVGTTSLASFLITTPAGHILINSDYERNVPTITDSVTKLGFAFEDVKILLGSHAHGDHMQGDAAVVELTHAKAMAMAEDLPALLAMRSPAGKPKVAYEALHDGSTVTLGGTTLTARLTPGHTPGCTTWTFTVMDSGRPLRVVIIGSIGVNPGTNLVGNPDLVAQYQRSHAILKTLPVDIPLGSHGAMFGLAQKHARLTAAPGEPNPYIDPEGYARELAMQEASFNAELERQRREGPPPARGR